MALSDIAIRKIKPTEKIQRYFDAKGLYLEVAPSGGKWWRFKYQVLGKEKRLSLGVYPDISIKDARERRDEARKQLANGIDCRDSASSSELNANLLFATITRPSTTSMRQMNL